MQATLVIAAIVLTFVLTLNSWLGFALCLGIWLMVVFAFFPGLLMPVAVTLPILLMRPNFWGELLSPVGVGLLAVVAFILFFARKAAWRNDRATRAAVQVPMWVFLSYLWALGLVAAHGSLEADSVVTGGILSVVALASMVLICSNPQSAKTVLRAYVGLTVIVCASYLVTAAIWAAGGLGVTEYASVIGGGFGGSASIHFPLTTTISSQSVFGFTIPRFVGFGREPGWMALWAGAAILLFRFTGWRAKWPICVLTIGAIGTISTGGFALLVVALAVNFTLATSRSPLRRTCRRALGFVVIVTGVWFSFNAPVVGVHAKGTQNAVSLEERSVATEAGIRALMNQPLFGGQGAEAVGAVNLIAAIAVWGLPWVLCIICAVVFPVMSHPRRKDLLPVMTLLLGTLLFSQPTQDSIWVFCVLIIALFAAQPLSRPTRAVAISKNVGSVPSARVTLGAGKNTTCISSRLVRTPADGGVTYL